MERTLGAPLADDALAVLADKTEGWAAGLRFATLTLRYGGDVDSHLAGLQAENRYVTDYLMSEVLSQVSPAMRRFLLKTSILDQVCSSLGEAMIGPDDPECQPQEYLVWLEQAAMFTVALDTHGEWYRYHHLFRELLRDQLARAGQTPARSRRCTPGPAPGTPVRVRLRRRCSTRCWGTTHRRLSV